MLITKLLITSNPQLSVWNNWFYIFLIGKATLHLNLPGFSGDLWVQGPSFCAPNTSELCLGSFLTCSLLGKVQIIALYLWVRIIRRCCVTNRPVHSLSSAGCVTSHRCRNSLSFIFLICNMGEIIISKGFPGGHKGERSRSFGMCCPCLQHPPLCICWICADW